MLKQQRFETWCGQGLPKAWAENMGIDAGDTVWPIVDTQTSGPINGRPNPEQMLCWCPSLEKQTLVASLLKSATGDVDAWASLGGTHDPNRPSCEISHALSDIVSGVVKSADAPMSANAHLDSAIDTLAKLTAWRPVAAESQAVIHSATSHMSHYRRTGQWPTN